MIVFWADTYIAQYYASYMSSWRRFLDPASKSPVYGSMKDPLGDDMTYCDGESSRSWLDHGATWPCMFIARKLR